ncbi:MAG: class I SAM-dependent methyltransferase [Acidimicrobiales bacterium]
MTITQQAETNNRPADTDETREDWQIAGDAWSHAAIDWAYRFEPYARDAVERVFDELQVGPSTDLLDMACGSGYALGRAERLGARTAGIDASAGLLEIAERRSPDSELVAGSMFELPWPDESFDAVTSFNGIWGGCQEAVDEAFRVLRPGGAIAITFWGPGHALDLRDFFIVIGTTAPGVAEELKGLASIGQPGVCEDMLETSGFNVVERGATSAVVEACDGGEAWLTLRSPGVVLPSLDHVGEDELRRQVMASVEPYRAGDGSYRMVNELTHVIARKPS